MKGPDKKRRPRRCTRCIKANRKASFQCRVCLRQVCEHLCAQKLNGVATCNSCLLEKGN